VSEPAEASDPSKDPKADFWRALGCLMWVVVFAVVATLIAIWDPLMDFLKAKLGG